MNLVISNIVLKVLNSDSTLNFSQDSYLDNFSRFGFGPGTIFTNMAKLAKKLAKTTCENHFSRHVYVFFVFDSFMSLWFRCLRNRMEIFSSSRIYRQGALQNGTGTSANFGSLKISPIDSTCENTIRKKKNYAKRFPGTCFKNSRKLLHMFFESDLEKFTSHWLFWIGKIYNNSFQLIFQ